MPISGDSLLTSALTISGALVVYGATQFAQRFWLDPATDLTRALSRASYLAIYYANIYSRPGVVREELTAEASRELRKCAAELRAGLRAVRSYLVFRAFRQVPARDEVKRAADILVGLSNATKKDDTRDAWREGDELRRILGLSD